MLDPNKNKSIKIKGEIVPTKNKSLSAVVALKEIEKIKDESLMREEELTLQYRFRRLDYESYNS